MQKEVWSIRARGEVCHTCGNPFEDLQVLLAELFWTPEEGYQRRDYCSACAEQAPREAVLSFWKTVYHKPPAPAGDAVKKETAETLLRRLMLKEEAGDVPVVFVLAVMLERRRELVERSVTDEGNGEKLRVYEHRRSGEVFVIRDPNLRLDELETVQQQVIDLLGRG